MAMLRVSSYRRLFEEGSWGRNGGAGVRCAGQYRAPARSTAADACNCDKIDFVAARSLNEEGLTRFVQDRTIIAALNDRFVRLIELARCFEEENECLEREIQDLEDRLACEEVSVSSTGAVPDLGLDAEVRRLSSERDGILCDSELLQKELEYLMCECEKATQQRLLVQQEQQYISEDVDAAAAACLALRERVAIYEKQLASMEGQHETAVESLLRPAESTTGDAAVIKFGTPDITAALDVKEYYSQLAQSLQCECGVSSSVDDGKLLEAGGAGGSMVKSSPLIKDIGEMKVLISDMQKEVAELQKCNEDLEEQVEINRESYVEEIAELKCTVDDMRHQEAELQSQMSEQCEDYKELMREKMARDMEICAYRSLVEEEEQRLCVMSAVLRSK